MIQKTSFGKTAAGEEVDSYTITNSNGLSISVLTLGCTLQSVQVPYQNGKADICLGYDTPDDYLSKRSSMGAVCGRFANRIANGRFSLNGCVYQLAVNNGPNHLHGGLNGFAYRIWEVSSTSDNSVTFMRLSPDGEENYPGNLTVKVTYTLDSCNTISIRYEAVSDKDTILNLTNHAYWNLNGHDDPDAMNHLLSIPASYYCPCDNSGLVTGEIVDVDGSAFDFRDTKKICDGLKMQDPQLICGSGFDHCYLLDGSEPIFLKGDLTGITMRITTDMPAVHLYTANHLKNQTGKHGASYHPRNSVCLETEQVPDSPNKPQFPSSILKANDCFVSTTNYQINF